MTDLLYFTSQLSYWTKKILNLCSFCSDYTERIPSNHRRRIKTEEKAKVVASVWGKEFIQFLAVLAFFHQDDFKKGEFNFFLHIILVQFSPFLLIILVQNIVASTTRK